MQDYSDVSGPYLSIPTAERVMRLTPKGKMDEGDQRKKKKERKGDEEKEDDTKDRKLSISERIDIPGVERRETEETEESDEPIKYGKSKSRKTFKPRIDMTI